MRITLRHGGTDKGPGRLQREAIGDFHGGRKEATVEDALHRGGGLTE
jgi:hypothetical protein